MLDNENSLFKPLKIGETVEGKIISINKKGVFLDLGPRGTGIIYGRELIDAKEVLKGQKIGDKMPGKVVDLDNEEGFVELSVAQARKEIVWEEMFQKKKKGEIITVKILKANKGGLVTEQNGIPAFLPVSQLSPENYPRIPGGGSSQILKELQKFIGQELTVTILDFNRQTNQVILSEKAKETGKIREILKNYKTGDVVEGEITGIVGFGVFIKFPLVDSIQKKRKETEESLEGLIHISELDWKIIEDPSEIVKVGQRVKAKIVDIVDDRVSLSLKALKKDPWEGIEEKYKKGDIVSGKITKFNPFGTFVQISPKIQGLCHVSEFGSVKKMEEKLKVGEKCQFKILLIDPKEHRMTLQLIKE